MSTTQSYSICPIARLENEQIRALDYAGPDPEYHRPIKLCFLGTAVSLSLTDSDKI